MAEGGGLENRFPATGRGFESYSLRQEIQRSWISPVVNGLWLVAERTNNLAHYEKKLIV